MKTPEDIKKGLKCCGTTIVEGRRTICNAQCTYITEGIFCRNVLHGDTNRYIFQLELFVSQVSKALCGKENAALEELLQAVSQVKSRLAQVERERDVLEERIHGECSVCANGKTALCNDCIHNEWAWHPKHDYWKLDGACKENAKEK